MNSRTGKLELKGLVKQFGIGKNLVTAVDQLTMTINPGEFVTFLGPSGCGKTTSLRMIAGFEIPTAGSILLDGEDISNLTPDKRPMGMVFQSYALFPHMNVYENIAYGLKIKKLSKPEIERKITAILKSMSLDSLANRQPNQLSGGQQQRVALARAMVVEPKVLLFDEPLSNLDAKLRGQMRTEIRSIQQQLGITSIFVTHDQDEAMSVSDRIVVMRNAVVQQIGSPQEIYTKPNSVFVADFIGRSNFIAAKVVGTTRNGQVEVEILGKKSVVPVGNLNADKEVKLLVRPEAIQVSKEPAVNLISGRGKVSNVIYYGEHVEYELSTEIGPITAITSNPDLGQILELNNDAYYSFESTRTWLLNQD